MVYLYSSSSVFRDLIYRHNFDSLKIILSKLFFGYEFNIVLELLFLVSILAIFSSGINNKKYRILFSIFASLFITLEQVSFYFVGTFIGNRFLIHFQFDTINNLISLFYIEIIVFIIISLLNFSLFCCAHKFIKLKERPKIKYSIYAISLIFIIFSNNFILQSYKAYHFIFQTHNKITFEKSTQGVGFSNYTDSRHVIGKKGKNIIVISLESLEAGFLNEKFNHLLPNIQELSKQWHKTPIGQNDGSNWTSGSLYTTMTGMPAYFGIDGNSIFRSVYESRIPSIPSLTKSLGYQNTFIIGNADFSGNRELLKVLGFNEIIDRNDIPNSPISQFGLHDKDVFELAKKSILKHSKNESYLCFISTCDTHFPNGIPDNRLRKLFPKCRNDYEFTLKCLDFLVSDFVKFLNATIDTANTSIFIIPDHTKMGNPSMLNGTGKRELYLLCNQPIQYDLSKPNYQIDIAPIILKTANIHHNISFLADIIKGDKAEFINEKHLELMTMNTNGILNMENRIAEGKSISPNYSRYKSDRNRFIAHAGGNIEGFNYTNSLESLDLSYKNGYKFFELDLIKTRDNKLVACHDWETWKEYTNFNGSLPPTEKEFLSHKILDKFTPLNVQRINEWFKIHNSAFLVTDKINNPPEVAVLFPFVNRIYMELFTTEAVDEALKFKFGGIMLTESLVTNTSKMRLYLLKNKGVNFIACSRSIIEKFEDKLDYLKSIGYKTYFYDIHAVNFGIDEDYVLKYELDHGFGIYSDEWKFK